jgi:hypothetical protein
MDIDFYIVFLSASNTRDSAYIILISVNSMILIYFRYLTTLDINPYLFHITHGIETKYSLRPILLFANTDVSTTKMCLDTSILVKSNMGRREYYI